MCVCFDSTQYTIGRLTQSLIEAMTPHSGKLKLWLPAFFCHPGQVLWSFAYVCFVCIKWCFIFYFFVVYVSLYCKGLHVHLWVNIQTSRHILYAITQKYKSLDLPNAKAHKHEQTHTHKRTVMASANKDGYCRCYNGCFDLRG